MIDIKIDEKEVLQAMSRAPRIMARHIERGLGRAAQEVAREERDVVPKAFSNLMNSIRENRISPFERHVNTGVNYARAVEEGTEPGHMPPWQALAPWIHQKTKASGRELRNRAFGLARYIKEHGTKAQPYAAPTAKKMESRVIQLVRESIGAGLSEAGLK